MAIIIVGGLDNALDDLIAQSGVCSTKDGCLVSMIGSVEVAEQLFKGELLSGEIQDLVIMSYRLDYRHDCN